MRSTKRVARRVFTYGAAYPETVVRVGLRSEIEIVPTSTDVAVVETFLGNIKLERR